MPASATLPFTLSVSTGRPEAHSPCRSRRCVQRSMKNVTTIDSTDGTAKRATHKSNAGV
jgi:hypothetical protein